MATTKAGGRIRHDVALTLVSSVALEIGDMVMMDDQSYECKKADGTKPNVGQVTVANKVRSSTGVYPASQVPGDVTVEANGFAVWTLKSGGALATPGVAVGINGVGKVAAAGAGVARLGILLTTATAADQDVDVLVGGNTTVGA